MGYCLLYSHVTLTAHIQQKLDTSVNACQGRCFWAEVNTVN